MGKVDTVKAITGAAEIVDGGVVLHGGNIDGQNVTVSQGFTIFAGVDPLANTTVFPDGTHLTATRSLSAGTFGKQAAGLYLMPRITTSLAGVSNTIAFQTASSNFGTKRSIHWKERARFGYVSDFDIFTGSGTQVAANHLYHDIDSNGEGAIDAAAHPTRPIPGLFANYDFGPGIDQTATLKVYPAKNL